MNEFRVPQPDDASPSVTIESLAHEFLAARRGRLYKALRRVRSLQVRHVHRARTELRRMRATLELFAPILQGDLTEKLIHRLGKITRLLGPVRDLDVLLERSFTWPQTRNSEDLVQFLFAVVDRRRKLANACRKKLTGQGIPRVFESLDSVRVKSGVIDGTIEQHLRGLFSKLPEFIDFKVSEINSIHDLRKKCRQLRYQFELVQGIVRGESTVGFLKQAQVHFGQLNDSAVIIERLRGADGGFLTQPLAESILEHEQHLLRTRLPEANSFWNGPLGLKSISLR